MCYQMCINLKDIREFQKDFLKGKHLDLSKNLCKRYRQLITDLVFNQQLQFGSESNEETKNKIQKLNILIAQKSCSQISIFNQIFKLKGQHFKENPN